MNNEELLENGNINTAYKTYEDIEAQVDYELKEKEYKKQIKNLQRLNYAFEKGLDRRSAEFAVFNAEQKLKDAENLSEEETEELFMAELENIIKEIPFLKKSRVIGKTGLRQEDPLNSVNELDQRIAKIMGVKNE